jgi:ubiquinone/menaquinone biosynthesis C-methylase UbiE
MRRPVFIATQARHPHGLLGAILGRLMAHETAADNERAIAMLRIESKDRVLDIGTGHGRSLGVMADLADKGLVVGVDASDTVLRIAARRNRTSIKAGRVRLEKAPSDALPFGDASFDKAMAVHTLYFWNPAQPHLREIARVLKKNGLFVVGFRPAEDAIVTARFPDTVYTFRTMATVEALLVDAGFEIIESRRREVPGDSMTWLLARRT